GNRYVTNSIPDYTFGGILVNEPACDVEAALRRKFAPSYTGIYAGTTWDYNNGTYPYSGSFGLFVDGNQQAVLIGCDTNQSWGLFLAFPLDKHGDWELANDVNGGGYIDSDGSVYGGWSSP